MDSLRGLWPSDGNSSNVCQEASSTGQFWDSISCLKPKSNAGGCISQGGIDKELWDCIFMFWGMLWGLVLQGSINKQFWYIYICAQTQLFCWKVLYLCCYRKLHQHQSPDYKPLLLWNAAALHITDLVCLHQQNCSLFSVTCGCFG